MEVDQQPRIPLGPRLKRILGRNTRTRTSTIWLRSIRPELSTPKHNADVNLIVIRNFELSSIMNVGTLAERSGIHVNHDHGILGINLRLTGGMLVDVQKRKSGSGCRPNLRLVVFTRACAVCFVLVKFKIIMLWLPPEIVCFLILNFNRRVIIVARVHNLYDSWNFRNWVR